MLELSPELVRGFLIMGLSLAFLGTVGTLRIVMNEDLRRRIAERYAERPPATIAIATDVVDLVQLETLAEKVGRAYSNRYERLERMSERDRSTLVGMRLAYVCSLLRDASNHLNEVVTVLDGSKHLSRTDHIVKAVATKMLDDIEPVPETTPLKGVGHLEPIQ